MADVVWLNGELIPEAEATVSVFDHGLTVGDGVFETIKAVGGTPFAVRRHLERLRRSASALGLDVPYDDAKIRDAISDVLSGRDLPLARVRLTLSGGVAPLGSERAGALPTVVVAAAAMAPPAATTSVCVAPWPRNERAALAGVKSTSYAENVLALAYAHERSCSEALFETTTGNLCEGTGSNVFAVVDGQLVTPPLASGCLAGVTRDLVLAVTDATEIDIPMADFARADEVFLTSTGRDVQPVDSVDQRPLGAPGHITRAAADAFADLVASGCDP